MTLFNKYPKAINSDLFFRIILRNSLIYNTCWEDPQIDRNLLGINSESKIAMITSAGCNALDYLLDSPTVIHTADINFRQNALLELKIAVIQNTDYKTLFQIFGKGKFECFYSLYFDYLRQFLSEDSQKYWDNNTNYFTRKNSFYYNGTTGLFAKIINNLIDSKNGLRSKINDFFESRNLDEQTERYLSLEGEFWNKISDLFINNQFTLSLLGIPFNQRKFIANQYDSGLAGFLRVRLKKVFTEIDIKQNYFWRVYFFGEYSPEIAPNYLKNENYELLKNNCSKIKIYNGSFKEMIDKRRDYFNHFVLLDHQDWQNYQSVNSEWQSIYKSAAESSNFIARSVSLNNYITNNLQSVLEQSKVDAVIHQDRVPTYAGVFFGSLK